GTRIASGNGNTVRVWDVETGQELLTLKGHTGWVYSVAFSPDGTRIVSGSGEGAVKVWEAHTGQEALSLQRHTSRVTSVGFSPDGRTFASGSDDTTVCLWDTATGDLIAWRAFQRAIGALWFRPETRQLFIADDGGGAGRPCLYVLEILRPNP